MIRPFCYFVKDNFNKFGLGKTSGEVSKILSEQWKNLPDDQKNVYHLRSQEDMKRYLMQKEELLTKGYFILDDGSKSNEQ